MPRSSRWGFTAMLMALSFLIGIRLACWTTDRQLRELEADDYAKFRLLQDCHMRLPAGPYYDQGGAIRGPRREPK